MAEAASQARNPLNDPEVANRVFHQFLELFFNPEIERRMKSGGLPHPFELVAAQVVFPPGRGMVVRLNEEVRIGIHATLHNGTQTENKKYNLADIAQVHAVAMPEADRDSGHATMFRVGSSWSISFDFRKNGRVRERHKEMALEFLITAGRALEASHSRAFVDNLFSACELAAKASLLWILNEQYNPKGTHGAVKHEFLRRANAIGIPSEVVELFKLLREKRVEARYRIEEFTVRPDDAAKWTDIMDRFVRML